MLNNGVIYIGQSSSAPSPPDSDRINIYCQSGSLILQDFSGSTLNITEYMRTGWIPINDTWSYLSASAITVPTGAVNRYAVGNKIKLTQTTVKYFYIIDVTNTVLQVAAGDEYSIANAPITNPNYSLADTPVNFPQSFTYTPVWTATGGSVGGGNTTLKAEFSVNNRICTYAINMQVGTTTWLGTTTVWQFSLPIRSGNGQYFGVGRISDATAPGTYYFPKPRIDASANVISYIFIGNDTSNNSNLAYNIPITWAQSDILSVSINYLI
jgi:hypothetical protein